MSARCSDRFTSTEAADEISLVLLHPPDRDRRSKNSIRQGIQSSLDYTEIFISWLRISFTKAKQTFTMGHELVFCVVAKLCLAYPRLTFVSFAHPLRLKGWYG